MHVQDMQGIGMTSQLTLAAFIALCSGALKKTCIKSMVVLGSMSIGEPLIRWRNWHLHFKFVLMQERKKVLLPMASAADINTVPPELFSKFQISFIKALKMRYLKHQELSNIDINGVKYSLCNIKVKGEICPWLFIFVADVK